jgi:hypothetical protein
MNRLSHGRRRPRSLGAAVLMAAIFMVLLVGCSPEASRRRGAGPGADTGNIRPPVELHGSPQRNNPSFGVPARGRVPSDARGLRGWWERG